MPRRPIVWSRAACTGDSRRAAPSRAVGCSARGSSPVGTSPVTPRSTGTANCGAFAAAAKVLISPTVLCGSGLTRWKAWPSRSGLVGDVGHRLRDVVHRHHVGVAEVDPDQGHPAGDGVAHPLEQREEVVGTVDLVHRAGLGVADHDRRPVDPPRHRGTPRARSSRTRTWCGGRPRAAAGPRRTWTRRRRPCSHRRPRRRRPGGSGRPRAWPPARWRCGCRRRS